MVAQNSSQSALVKVAGVMSSSDRARRFRSRDLLPWADPYIASLIRRLQAEVRAERAGRVSRGRHHLSALDIRRSPIRSEAQRRAPKPDGATPAAGRHQRNPDRSPR